MDRASGEFPKQPSIDRSECQTPLTGKPPKGRLLLQKPGHFGTGKIRIPDQPGDPPDLRFGGFQPAAEIGGAAILPNNGPMDRFSGPAVPQERCLALVGNSDGGNLRKPNPPLLKPFSDDVQYRTPKVGRVMLHPAGLWEILMDFSVGLRNDSAVPVEENGARAGRSLVNREDVRLYFLSASTSALPNASAASGPEPVMILPSVSTGFPV